MYSSNKRYLAAALLLLFTALPFGGSLVFAACYASGIIGGLRTGSTFSHWQAVLHDAAVWQSFGLSAGIATVVTGLSVGLALQAVRYFGQAAPTPFLRFLLPLPLSMPPLVAAFWGFQLFANTGLLARAAYQLGIIGDSQQFFSLINEPYHLGIIALLVLPNTFVFWLLFWQFYLSENVAALANTAQTLGATTQQIRRRIIAPLLLWRAQSVIMLQWIFAFGSFEIPLLLGVQSPRMVSVLIHHRFSKYDLLALPQAYAIAVLYMALVLIVVLALPSQR